MNMCHMSGSGKQLADAMTGSVIQDLPGRVMSILLNDTTVDFDFWYNTAQPMLRVRVTELVDAQGDELVFTIDLESLIPDVRELVRHSGPTDWTQARLYRMLRCSDKLHELADRLRQTALEYEAGEEASEGGLYADNI